MTYRFVNASLSKLLELYILSKNRAQLANVTTPIWFKKEVSTDMIVYILKETIFSYINNNSLVFCYLDASRAYDRVNQWT